MNDRFFSGTFFTSNSIKIYIYIYCREHTKKLTSNLSKAKGQRNHNNKKYRQKRLLKYIITLISEGVSIKFHFGWNEVCLFRCLVNLLQQFK